MTSLQGSLPRSGSALWRKDRGRLSSENDCFSPVIKHVVIREVWQKTHPSPHALYKVDVMTKSNHWSVLRRYREFRELHKMLINQYGIPKDMLPPKKYTSKMLLSHLEKRKEALEHYLQRLVNSSTYVSSSPEIMEFLEVRSHDVMSVTKSLAKELFGVGESVLAKGEEFTLTPTQLYCITRQLQLPEPSETTNEPGSVDLGHLYGFVYQLQKLCVSNLINKVGPGQKLAGHLEFDVSLFKALKQLRIEGCPIPLLKSLSAVQCRLSHLTANYCIKTMKELLVDCVVERRAVPQAKQHVESWRGHATARLMQDRTVVQPWLQLTHLTLRHNKLAMFDTSLKLMPVLIHLDLSHNEFVHFDLQQLSCPSLTHLNLSHNDIHFVTGTPRTMSHLKSLDLSHNNLEMLTALDCFSGLIELDISDNQIRIIHEVSKLSPMLQLKYLSVAGNPFTRVKPHRVIVFSFFKGKGIILDKKHMTTTEKVKLRSYPSKLRSHSSPGGFAGDEDDNQPMVTPTRSHSFDVFGHPESDNDSGIEGASSFHSDIIVVDPEDSEDGARLDFAWSYFDQGMDGAGSVDTVVVSGQTEELGFECSNQAVSAETVAEVGAEVDASDVDADFGSLSGSSLEGVHSSHLNVSEVECLPSNDGSVSPELNTNAPEHQNSRLKQETEELHWALDDSHKLLTKDSNNSSEPRYNADGNDLSEALQQFSMREQSLNDLFLN